ncbi:hypothetical protein ACU4GD_20845 [Cupriavidus basilensis]
MVLLLFIGQEFCSTYWYHRASHRIRFFWAAAARSTTRRTN